MTNGALDAADRRRKDEGENHGDRERGENLGDDVEAAGLEDRVTETFGGGHEFADDCAYQREADGQLEAREDVRERGGENQIAEYLVRRRAERAHQVDLVRIDSDRTFVRNDQRDDNDR